MLQSRRTARLDPGVLQWRRCLSFEPTVPLLIGEQGGWLRGGYPLLKKKFMTPPPTLKMSPTPSEMAF